MGGDLSPLGISLKTAFTATIFAFFVGIAAAQGVIQLKGKKKGIIDGILNLPLVLPPTVLGFFLLMFFGKNGPMGKFLALFDQTIIFSWYATVLAAATVAFPLMYKTVRAAFEQVDSNLLQAARTLGVSEWRIFWKITLPMAWPGIAAGTILAFARALGEFGATLMIAGNIPGKTQTMPLAIFFAAEGGDMETALAWVLTIVAISLFVIFVMNFWLDQQQKFLSRRRG